MERMKMESTNWTNKNVEQIGELFPNAITEINDGNGGIKKGINFEILKQELSNSIDEENERYEFSWVGKKQAILEANKSVRKTLRPKKDESINWEETNNLYIEGDNLEVLKVLQESYLNSIKMIYIDPPYNTKNDLLYKDNFSLEKNEFEEKIGVFDEEENRLFKNTESNGRFHSDWCSMLYPRLKIAQKLLKDDGVIFISIDDNEQATLKMICDEVFGPESFVTVLHIEMSATQGMKVKAAQNGNIVKNSEYVLVYSKNGRKNVAENILYDYRDKYDTHYSKIITENDKVENLTSYINANEKGIAEELDYLSDHLGKKLNLQEMYDYSIKFREFVDVNKEFIFRFDKVTGFTSHDVEDGTIKKVNRGGREYTLINKNGKIEQLLFLKDSFGYCDDFKNSYGLRKIRGDWWKDFYKDMGNVSKEGDMKFENGKKPIRLIKQLIKMATNDDDIILDFFSGSATTAHATMELNQEEETNRSFILVQLKEEIDNKNSLYKAGYKYVTEVGKQRIKNARQKLINNNEKIHETLDLGLRVFEIDSSNMKDIYYSANDYSQDLIASLESNIKEDRTDMDLLYGVMLGWGLHLSLKHEIDNINGTPIHIVDHGSLIACFAEKINEDVVTDIAKRQPLRVVFRDSSFNDSPDKINVTEIFKLYAPNTTVKVI